MNMSYEKMLAIVMVAIRPMVPGDVVLKEDTSLASLRISSLKILTLVARIEDELKIEFDPDDLTVENFESIQSLVALALSRIEIDGAGAK